MPTPRPEKEEARNRRSEAEAGLSSVAEGEGGRSPKRPPTQSGGSEG